MVVVGGTERSSVGAAKWCDTGELQAPPTTVTAIRTEIPHSLRITRLVHGIGADQPRNFSTATFPVDPAG